MQNITIYGHAYTRVFTYTENSIYHELETNGGAYLLHDLLTPDSTGGNSIQRDRDRVYYELLYSGEKGNYWSIGRNLGIAGGKSTEKVVTIGSGENLVIWDEGLGGISLQDKVCPILWASNKALPDPVYFNKIAAHCMLLLDADVLRKEGAMVSRQISWERTATELVWQLQNNPDITYLLKARHVIITFAEDGAVHIRKERSKLKASLVLTHGGGEGVLRSKPRGSFDDAFILMTASLVHQFPAVMSGDKPLKVLPLLKTAETLMTTGYTLKSLKNCEYCILTETEKETAFDIPSKPGQDAINTDSWCISNNVSGKRIFDIAFEYVMNGAKAIDNLPQLSIGALTTIDRWEIEAFQNIRNLIVNYAADNLVRPLSIAVFGAPGSGKSFGVSQIAQNVLPGKVEKLEFNVSQFTGMSDLGAAFQKVRDAILTGKLPLVFFDEFDSDKDGKPLGWIKSFLMPMQDGKFKDESGEHPLGKCILVFAGGTAASFAEFSKPMTSKNQEEKQAFKNVKGPDFISRLKGTINVFGPNQKGKNDNNYILRRALLLRSLCERKLKISNGTAPVSPDILRAMLLVPMYKHGARSMEAILDMSRMEGNIWEPVSLPFYSQLSLHVDADAFIKLVLREVILNSYIEQLAQAIHADFVKERIAKGETEHKNAVPWDKLTEEKRESNREAARNFGKDLNTVGYAYDAGDTPFPSVNSFDKETRQIMAKNQHTRWMEELTANGWVYGEQRDDEAKVHPFLLDWDMLPPEEQKKDFDIVESIIPLFKSIGLRVYKTV